MIKVNLLTNYSAIGSEVLQEIELQNRIKSEFLKKTIIFLVGPLILYAYEFYNIPLLEQEKNQTQAQLSQIIEFNQKKDVIAKEIEKYEEDKKKLNAQTQFLERISKERMYPVEFLTKLKALIPASVWLTSIENSGKKISLKGESESEVAINQLESALKTIEAIHNVRLNDSQAKESPMRKDLIFKTFVISTEYSYEVTNE